MEQQRWRMIRRDVPNRAERRQRVEILAWIETGRGLGPASALTTVEIKATAVPGRVEVGAITQRRFGDHGGANHGHGLCLAHRWLLTIERRRRAVPRADDVAVAVEC